MKAIKWIILTCLLTGSALADGAPKQKFALILQSGAETNEAKSRAVHSLLYARELLENGYDVALIYDGAGTGWAYEFRNPENGFHEQYLKVKKQGMFEEVCDNCAEHFDVKAKLANQEKMLLVSDYEGHPSIVRWIKKGYQIIIL